jgi:hypothetical protein
VNIGDFAWNEFEGRDAEGDKYKHVFCLHGSGRILATIDCPIMPGRYVFHATFDCSIPETVLKDGGRCFDFIDEESAKRFVECVLTSFDPFAKPREKRAIRVRAKTRT